MHKENTRRSFLTKFSLGTLAAWIGLSGYKNQEDIKMEKQPVADHLTRVKAMGFQWDTRDPFLFCVHHEDFFPAGDAAMQPPPESLNGRSIGDDFIIKDGWRMYHGSKIPGFPGHPHRGFETITIVRKGIVDHADSLGASGRYGEGDVQWMTAGGGVQHSEMFPLVHKDKPNTMELFQIWLNLPKANKMVDPHFKMLWGSQIPKLKQEGVEVEIIAGSIGTMAAPAPPPNSWAADPNNHVAIYNITLAPGAHFTLPKTQKGVNRYLYYYVGDGIQISGTALKGYHSAMITPDIDMVIENGNTEARILVMQGKPIGEPVIQYGPFVMNTKEEIQQAFQDYHQTQFGGWPWPSPDQVHDRTLGRFAKHADGRVEKGA